MPTDILEKLQEDWLRLSRGSFDSVDCGLAANVVLEAIDEIERLRASHAHISERIGAGWKCLAVSKAACAWPDCGCDPEATKVVAALVDQGWSPPGARETCSNCGKRQPCDDDCPNHPACNEPSEAAKTCNSYLQRALDAESRLAEAEKVIRPFASYAEATEPGDWAHDSGEFGGQIVRGRRHSIRLGHLRAARAFLAPVSSPVTEKTYG